MFRNQVSTPSTEAFLGRPPTPPAANSVTSQPSQNRVQSSPYFPTKSKSSPMGTNVLAGKSFRDIPKPSPKKSSLSASASKSKSNKGNTSILSFFGKTDGSLTGSFGKGEDDLFFQDRNSLSSYVDEPSSRRSPSPSAAFLGESELAQPDTDLRFNEVDIQIKRRRLSPDDSANKPQHVTNGCTPPPPEAQLPTPHPRASDHNSDVSNQTRSQKRSTRIGGFIDDSEGEDDPHSADEDGEEMALDKVDYEGEALLGRDSILIEENGTKISENKPTSTPSVGQGRKSVNELSSNELTSKTYDSAEQMPPVVEDGLPNNSGADIDGFAGLEDFENDEFFQEGEEYMERKFMEEQQLLEVDFENDEQQCESLQAGTSTTGNKLERSDSVTNCPICNASLEGITESEVSSHVNACLDGNPIPVPTKKPEPKAPPSAPPIAPGGASKRFQRSAIARPAQENPYSLSSNGQPKSAFSQLMSGHAEDAAWAAAATNEVKSRGKPAYDRTCPFYKIMPGLFICVDAFRYGAVEGQKAYFLSHFHSDHYVGLTSSWCHGPIYCSKVTGNLVRQSLRVDPKWVVDLEFEKKVEVPGTQGVHVTMIPANHCPGSSLFMFEKALSKGPNPKLKRILHCGDFRACPAHVNHPLLRHSVRDIISGKTRDQTIDTCYLDTTYLTPKYAFPSQEDVITACAHMCVSLSKDIVDSGDHWEQAKRERAGSGMVKFLDKAPDADPLIKAEDDTAEDIKPQKRGRLLVVIGTYSIGKERICLGIARALNSKIYAPPSKQRICSCLEDPELTARLTSNPLEAQVHMQMLMEIRAETLAEYLASFRGKGNSSTAFERVVGFRPTGWNYRPPTSRFTENPAVSTVLHSEGWKSRFTMKDLVPQRGSTRESNCFGVPYSEHSSFRELTMFCTALRIGKVVPTVNVGGQRSRERMKGWVEKWEAWKRKEGFFEVEEGATSW